MSFLADIESPSELCPQTSFAFAKKFLPEEWIEQAMTETGTQSAARRKLPAASVVWLVIAMLIFRDRSIHAAACQLGLVHDLEAPPGRGKVAPGAVAKARARLGEKPLETLFRRTAHQWAMSAADSDRWQGLSVFAMDGSGFNVSDTSNNDAEFGRLQSAKATSAYPKVRVVALNAPRSHLLLDVEAPRKRASACYRLWDRLPDHGVTLIDRGFLA